MSSGTANGAYARVDRVQDVRAEYQLPRTTVSVLGRFAPLPGQPVINYTDVQGTVNYTKGNKDVERNLGLLNTTGVMVQIAQNTDVTTWGARNYLIRNAPVDSTTYAGQWELVTGVLRSFSLNGSVGDAVRGTFSVEGLDLRQSALTSTRSIPNYSGQLITPENQSLTGINFTGFGYTGLTVQNFTFQLSLNYAKTHRIGSKYPEKRLTEAGATLQINGFMEGHSNTLPSISGFDLGSPIAGQYVLRLQPACGPEPATTITMINPYLTSHSIGMQVGNFTEVNLGFACPLSIIPAECIASGNAQNSNVTIV